MDDKKVTVEETVNQPPTPDENSATLPAGAPPAPTETTVETTVKQS